MMKPKTFTSRRYCRVAVWVLLLCAIFYAVLYISAHTASDSLTLYPPPNTGSAAASKMKYFHHIYGAGMNWKLNAEQKAFQKLHEEQFTQTSSVDHGEDIKMVLHDPAEDIFISKKFTDGGFYDESGITTIKRHIQVILSSTGFEPCGPKSPSTCDKYQELSKLGILDVGANIGAYSMGLARYFHRRYPFVDVFAFEPLWLNYVLLMRSMQLNEMPNVFLFPYGLSEEKHGTKSFVVDALNKGHSHIDGAQAFGKIDEEDTTATIETMSLDYIVQEGLIQPFRVMNSFRNILWMKIDTEGYEKFVFYGGKVFFSDPDTAPCLIKTEFLKNQQDLIDVLTGYGYSLVLKFNWRTVEQKVVPGNRLPTNTTLPQDAFFVRNELWQCITRKLLKLYDSDSFHYY